MSAVTDAPQGGFRLSQLIYDTRYRSITIQTVALVMLVAGLYWLINNTIENLAVLGKDFDFGFLAQPAGYDINQRLIEYDSQDTHGRAATVGILNTLLVAALGCVLTTILGVVAGVLRLSNNWIVSKLMAVYVEVFRNIPTLLWILLIFALMTESMYQPRDFRVGGDADMILNDTVAVTNRGVYLPALVFSNSLGAAEVAEGEEPPEASSTVQDWLLIIAALIASLIGTKAITRWANRTQEATGQRPTTWYLLLLGWIAPVGIVLFMLGAHLQYPSLQGFNFQDGIYLRNSFIALWLALSLYTGAFTAEIVRAGILAISKGQTEAAAALGLRSNRIMSLVILPQALRVIIPPLISQYLNLTKNTSLALAVGYMDVRSTLGGITINQTGKELEGMLLLGLFYLVLSLLISGGMNVYNKRTQLMER